MKGILCIQVPNRVSTYTFITPQPPFSVQPGRVVTDKGQKPDKKLIPEREMQLGSDFAGHVHSCSP